MEGEKKDKSTKRKTSLLLELQTLAPLPESSQAVRRNTGSGNNTIRQPDLTDVYRTLPSAEEDDIFFSG